MLQISDFFTEVKKSRNVVTLLEICFRATYYANRSEKMRPITV